MFKFSNTLASVATLALATVPMLALATGADAAPVAVTVSDIDTSSPEGAKVVNKRIQIAAREYCRQSEPGALSRLTEKSCIRGVEVEMAERVAHRNAMLAQARQAQLAQR